MARVNTHSLYLKKKNEKICYDTKFIITLFGFKQISLMIIHFGL